MLHIYIFHILLLQVEQAQEYKSESELIVVGYTLKYNSLSTQSALTLGIPYKTVAGMYGTVKKNMILNRNKFYYSYDWDDEKRTLFSTRMCFFVDKNNIITEIYVGTDWNYFILFI